MAGRRQHHVWQCIQRGFGQELGGKHHVWVYNRDGSSRRTSTNNFGSERDFLSDGKDQSADHFLTEYENRAQNFVQQTRQMPHDTALDAGIVAELITHFEMRSLFIREEASRLVDHVIASVDTHFRDARFRAKLLRAVVEKRPELLTDLVERAGGSAEDGRAAVEYIRTNLDETLRRFASVSDRSTQQVMLAMRERVREFAKSAHIVAVLKGFSEGDRFQRNLQLSYRVVRTEAPIILPDTGLALLMKSGAAPVSFKNDVIEFVICPIDSHCYICGSRNGTDSRSIDTLLRTLSSCSYKNFVAIEDSESLRRLARRIGRNARFISDETLREIISPSRLIEGLFQRP